jgi:hypothetical protein
MKRDMKKQMIIFSIILIEIMTATIKIDSIDSKHIQLNIIEQQIEEVIERFEVQPEYELEIVDEYILAMEGFLA